MGEDYEKPIKEEFGKSFVNRMQHYIRELRNKNRLEKTVKKDIPKKEASAPKRRGGRKQDLTSERYQEALEEGLTLEELEERYSFSPQKLGAMKRHYGELEK